MSSKVYLFALAGLLGLSACQRQMVGGFQSAHTESTARVTPAVAATTATDEAATVAMPAPEATTPVVVTQPVAASPVLLASVADQAVAAAKGTKYEARAGRLKAAIAKAQTATASGNVSAAPRKMNFAEKAMVKAVTKKLNKQITKAKQGQDTQALNGNVKIGLLLLVAALVLFLIPGLGVVGSIVAVVGVVFLVLGLIDAA